MYNLNLCNGTKSIKVYEASVANNMFSSNFNIKDE